MAENEKDPKDFPADVKAKFDFENINPCLTNVKTDKGRVEIDFSKITVAQAEKLMADGCKNVKRKGASAANPAVKS